MRALICLWADEPVIVINLFKALIGLLVAFGLILIGAQAAALVSVLFAILTVLGSIKERDRVTPVKYTDQYRQRKN